MMDCQEFRIGLECYVDGELAVEAMVASEVHAAECRSCVRLVERERRFRQLLRQQPRESAPAELRARIAAACRRSERRAGRAWVLGPTLAAASLLIALVVSGLIPGSRPPALVERLVDTHIMYAQIARPAEFASSSHGEVEEWFRDRVGLQVPVPAYSRAGIHLLGGRIAGADERKVAYLLYEKGHMLMSVFMVPGVGPGEAVEGRAVMVAGQEYRVLERKGYRTVSWVEGQTAFSLISVLDYDALLECADRLRAERGGRTRA